jgi:hypothetical protein
VGDTAAVSVESLFQSLFHQNRDDKKEFLLMALFVCANLLAQARTKKYDENPRGILYRKS